MKLLIRRLKKLSYENEFIENIIFAGYLVCEYILRFAFMILQILPTKRTKIVFCNMKGTRYGDNPMYISEALHTKKPDCEIVWLIDKDVEADIPRYVRKVRYGLWNNMIEQATASTWVDSNIKGLGTYKSKKQLFVQTWHGSYGIKRIGFDLNDNFSKIDRILYPYNSQIADLMISNSKKTSEIYRRALKFTNKMLEVGSPKNDIFFANSKNITSVVKRYFDIEGKGVILYAPTFRSDFNTNFLNADLEMLAQTVADIKGGEWVVLVRLHPQNLKESKVIKNGDVVINASEYSVMQELLAASDILITDYSSCMFDFITVPKPCFIYAPDLNEYETSRGNYWKFSQLPFPLARTQEELFYNLRHFDEVVYKNQIVKLHHEVGLCETGHAAEAVADYIIDFIENGKK